MSSAPSSRPPIWWKRRLNKHYTVGDEIANGITHGIGAALSVAGLTLLVVLAVQQGDVRHVVSFSIYGTSLFLLYLASTLYHSIQHPPARYVFRILDHAGIFLLIAGTYTPFLVVGIGGSFGTVMLVVIWSIAAVGICFKTIFVNKYAVVSTAAYVLMGWLAIFGWREMVTHLPPEAVYWLAAGGVSYTVGVYFFANTKIPFNHAIWHLFVLGGSGCHYWAVLHTLPAV